MADTFTDKLADLFKSPAAQALSPGSTFLFDLFGGFEGQRREARAEAAAPTQGEAELLKMLRDIQNANVNTRVQQRNEEVLRQAQVGQRQEQEQSQTQLVDRLAGAGLLESGIAQRGFQDIARQGTRDIRALATQLSAGAEQQRQQQEQRSLQAQFGVSRIQEAGVSRERQLEQQQEAERQANAAKLTEALQTAAFAAGGGIPSAGQAAQAPGGLAPDQLQQLLQLLGLVPQQQQQQQGLNPPAFQPAPLVFAEER